MHSPPGVVIINFGPGKTIGKVLMKTSGNFYKFEKACMVNLNVYYITPKPNLLPLPLTSYLSRSNVASKIAFLKRVGVQVLFIVSHYMNVMKL